MYVQYLALSPMATYDVLANARSDRQPAKPLLAEVFSACTFGHYCLTHKLKPLLSRQPDSVLAPGRVIWSSSVEAHRDTFTLDDIQSFNHPTAYESAKRLTDILCLSYTLPHVRPHTKALVGSVAGPSADSDSATEVDDSDDDESDATVGPRIYLSHPGVVASTLMPLPGWLFWAYQLALVFCRWMGSPWHTGTGYRGAYAPVWLTMQEQPTLDELHAERVKWGSAHDRAGHSFVKPTEVEDWGWNGTVEDPAEDDTEGSLNKRCGRRYRAQMVTEEQLRAFEELGAGVWQEMERMRRQWEEILAL